MWVKFQLCPDFLRDFEKVDTALFVSLNGDFLIHMGDVRIRAPVRSPFLMERWWEPHECRRQHKACTWLIKPEQQVQHWPVVICGGGSVCVSSQCTMSPHHENYHHSGFWLSSSWTVLVKGTRWQRSGSCHSFLPFKGGASQGYR